MYKQTKKECIVEPNNMGRAELKTKRFEKIINALNSKLKFCTMSNEFESLTYAIDLLANINA